MALRRVLAPLAVTALLAGAAWAAADDPHAGDPTEIIDTLLAGFSSFRDVSPADLQREVAEVGGIPFRSDVPLDFMGKADLVRYLRGVLDDEYPTARALAEQRTLVGLGLLADDVDLRGVRARLLEENVVGFYDERPGKKRLYAVSEHKQLTPANQIILAHELRHAMQDQYMNLHDALPDSVGDFDDRRLALMSLVEGDATLVMERFLAKRMGIDAGGLDLGAMTLPASMGMPDAPPVLRDQLVLPYLSGRQFTHAVWQKGGWTAVRAAWDRPPTTTEQILHPEKFLAGEAGRATSVPALAVPGGTVLAEGVLGELLTRTLLGEGSDAAAAGWGGDQFKAWDAGGRTVLAWRTVWDTDADRREFLESALAAFGRRDPAPVKRGRFTVFKQGRWRYAVGEDAGSVLLVSTDDPARMDQALSGLGAAR
jgi:hypothetical protein